MPLIKKIAKGLNKAGDLLGTNRTARVGADLASNFKQVIQGKNAKQNLYAKNAGVGEFAKDVGAVAAVGSAVLGGVAGLAAKKAVAKVAAPKTVSSLQKGLESIKEAERVNAHRFMRFYRGGKY